MPSNSKFVSLQRLVTKLTGKPGFALGLEKSKQVKEKSPDVYKTYIALRREYNTAWHTALSEVCGSKPKPYTWVVKQLASHGFEDVLPAGFTGLIDGKGDFFTSTGELIDGKPTITNFPKIKMNPAPDDSDSSWIFMGVRPNGEPGSYFYTKSQRHQNTVDKFQRVKNLDVAAVRRKWLPKVKKFDKTNAQCVGSVILEMLYQFTARIGTPGNSTFGVATIQVRHCKVSASGITITYPGKDSIRAVHKLVKSNSDHKPLIADILQLIEGKEARDKVFTVEREGKQLQVSPAYVNRLWRACGAGETTVHKIRTAAATQLFYTEMTAALMNEATKPTNQKEAAALFKHIAEKVGSLLNHVKRNANGEHVTGATALKSYIDASLQCLYWHELGLQLPKYLQEYEKSSQ